MADRGIDVGEQGVATGDIGADSQHVGHEDRPAVGEAFVIEQVVDEFFTAIALPALVEFDFPVGRDSADQIDGGTAEECLVVDDRSGDCLMAEVFAAEDVIEH